MNVERLLLEDIEFNVEIHTPHRHHIFHFNARLAKI